MGDSELNTVAGTGTSLAEINRTYLLCWLRRTDLLLRRQALALHMSSPDQDEALLGLYISEAEAQRLFSADLLEGQSPWDAAGIEAFAADLERLEGDITALQRWAAEQQPCRQLGFDHLLAYAGLDAFERDALLITILPEISLAYERLFGLLNNDVTRRRPTLELLLRLLCRSLPESLERRSRFAADAPLLHHHLLTLGTPSEAGASGLSQPVRADEGIVGYLLGDERLDARLAPWCRLSAATKEAVTLDFAPPLRQGRDALARLLRRREPLVAQIAGARGSGRRVLAESAAEIAGRAILIADSELLPLSTDGTVLVDLVFREAALRGAALLWRNLDTGDETSHRDLRVQVFERAAGHPGPTMITTSPAWEPETSLSVWRTELDAPDAAARERLWRSHLNGAGAVTDLQGLAASFRLTPAQIAGAATSARRAAIRRGGPGAVPQENELFAAARARSRRNLGDLATRVDLRFAWEDLVLPRDQIDRLREVCSFLRHRSTVYQQWGFGRTLPPNKGVSILFAGPSGTGKTMSASIIALELGLDMFRIDLSTVVSKYIGETEKNLEKIFREGEDSNAILFFDEADALFGKRSEVRDAHDRYANIETAYLLQRMESYDGVVILATNLRRNLDDAFTRRLDFAVDFALPEEEDRLRIWRNVIPESAPLATDVDLELLARRYKLSGGNIRNSAVAAAFLAAEEGGAIAMRHLLRAVRREHQKMGKLMQDDAGVTEPAARRGMR